MSGEESQVLPDLLLPWSTSSYPLRHIEIIMDLSNRQKLQYPLFFHRLPDQHFTQQGF